MRSPKLSGSQGQEQAPQFSDVSSGQHSGPGSQGMLAPHKEDSSHIDILESNLLQMAPTKWLSIGQLGLFLPPTTFIAAAPLKVAAFKGKLQPLMRPLENTSNEGGGSVGKDGVCSSVGSGQSLPVPSGSHSVSTQLISVALQGALHDPTISPLTGSSSPTVQGLLSQGPSTHSFFAKTGVLHSPSEEPQV